MLVDKFRRLVESMDLQLEQSDKESLASDLSRVVHSWLAKPDSERDAYLAAAIDRLVRRYRHTRQYAVEVVGRPSASRSKEEVASDVALYLRRALARIEKQAVREGLRPPFTNAEQRQGFQIKSIAEDGGSHKVVSHFQIAGVPSHLVRRAVLLVKRKGSFKVAEVRCEELKTG